MACFLKHNLTRRVYEQNITCKFTTLTLNRRLYSAFKETCYLSSSSCTHFPTKLYPARLEIPPVFLAKSPLVQFISSCIRPWAEQSLHNIQWYNTHVKLVCRLPMKLEWVGYQHCVFLLVVFFLYGCIMEARSLWCLNLCNNGFVTFSSSVNERNSRNVCYIVLLCYSSVLGHDTLSLGWWKRTRAQFHRAAKHNNLIGMKCIPW